MINKVQVFSCIALFSIFSLFFPSCEDHVVSSLETTEISFRGINDRILTDQQIDSIGIIHNEVLSLNKGFANFNWAAGDHSAELKSKLENLAISQTHQITIDPKVRKIDDNLALIQDSLQNSSNLAYFTDVLDHLDTISIDSVMYTEIAAYLEEQEKFARNSIQETRDLEAVLIFLTVTKSSSKLWLPVQQGGEGLLDNLSSSYLASGGNPSSKPDPCLVDVLAADGFSAAGAFIIEAAVIAGFATATCPPCAAALFIGVGLSAAWSSGVTYLTSDDC